MRDFRQLKVWKKGHQLTLALYRLTAGFPREEQYDLTGQIRRGTASIPMNIAEGCGREGDTELARFMQIAMGSASELEYQLLLAYDLGYIEQSDYEEAVHQAVEVKRMLAPFIKRLRANR